jgi:DNA-directed RNA polymerase sigma subunit (sigma70/sigma32)
MSTLEQKIGRSVDIEDIISEYGLDENDDEVKSINLINVSNVDSLDRDISSDGEGVSLIDILNDDGYYSKTRPLIDSDIKIKINQIINTLSLKEREIISALYGLNGLKPHTLAEVGEK